MLYVIFAIGCAAIAANLAQSGGYSYRLFFVLGLLFSVFGLGAAVVLYVRSRRPSNKFERFANVSPASTRPAPPSGAVACPGCGAHTPPGAEACPYCGEGLLVICPNCRARMHAGASACICCGTLLLPAPPADGPAPQRF